MNGIFYYKANLNDVKTLADYRIMFAIELTGEHSMESIEDGEPVYKQNGFQLHIEPTYRKYL